MKIRKNYGIIYRAFLFDGRSYIGQTTQSLEKRKNCHFRKSKKDQTHFANALRKYGKQFIWEILEECQNKKSLNLAECKWIDYFHSIENGFNLKTGGR